MRSGDVFGNPPPPGIQSALNGYANGSHGQEASRLAPQLHGKSLADVQAILDADVAAGRATKTSAPIPVQGQMLPQDVYIYPDGTVVRVKAQGGEPKYNPPGVSPGDPMYSVEVTLPGVTAITSQADIAFKVDPTGQPVPKGPEDIVNPYSSGTNELQFKLYQELVMIAGHRPTGP